MSVTAIQDKQPRYIDPNSPLAKQQEVFLQLMRDPPENSRIITIAPALAEWLLDTFNLPGANRKRKPARIVRYAEAMGHGAWMLTGEPLIFGRQQLLDGQNRLMGCVRAGKSFRTHVIFGVKDNVFAVVNSGKSRTASDTFFTAGIKDHSIISPAVRWLMLYGADAPTSRTSFSNQEMFSYYNDSKKIDKDALDLAVERSKLVSKVIPRPAIAAHFYLFAKKNEKAAAKMATDFDKNQHSARKLTSYLAKVRKAQQGRLNDVWVNALIVQTWNAYREGRIVTAKDLKWNRETQEYPAIA